MFLVMWKVWKPCQQASPFTIRANRKVQWNSSHRF